jgi:hypothetical protein
MLPLKVCEWDSHLMWLCHSSRTTCYDSLSEWLVTDQSFFPGTLVSSTNKPWYYKLFTFISVDMEIWTPWSRQVHPVAQPKGV